MWRYQTQNRLIQLRMSLVLLVRRKWLRGQDLNLWSSGYELIPMHLLYGLTPFQLCLFPVRSRFFMVTNLG